MGAFSSNAFGNPGGPYTPRPDLGPGVAFAVDLPGPEFQDGGPDLTTQNFNQSLPGYQQNTNTVFPGNQQQPITQSTGQLPPGFGAPSPIDRSQIGNAQIGFGMPPNGAMTRGNLNDYNGNPVNGGPFGTQNTIASPRMGGGFGGGKSGGPMQGLIGGVANQFGNFVAPALNQIAPGAGNNLGSQIMGSLAGRPGQNPPAPRTGIPVSQARRVNAPIRRPRPR